MRDGGNVEHDPHGEFTGKNILYLASDGIHQWETQAEEACADTCWRRAASVPGRISTIRFSRRWNGLDDFRLRLGGRGAGRAALCGGGAARGGIHIEQMYRGGMLLRRYRAGEAAIPGFLDDYALFVQALLDLYEAQFDARHLELAIELTAEDARAVRRRGAGGFFSRPKATRAW